MILGAVPGLNAGDQNSNPRCRILTEKKINLVKRHRPGAPRRGNGVFQRKKKIVLTSTRFPGFPAVVPIPQ